LLVFSGMSSVVHQLIEDERFVPSWRFLITASKIELESVWFSLHFTYLLKAFQKFKSDGVFFTGEAGIKYELEVFMNSFTVGWELS